MWVLSYCLVPSHIYLIAAAPEADLLTVLLCRIMAHLDSTAMLAGCAAGTFSGTGSFPFPMGLSYQWPAAHFVDVQLCPSMYGIEAASKCCWRFVDSRRMRPIGVSVSHSEVGTRRESFDVRNFLKSVSAAWNVKVGQVIYFMTGCDRGVEFIMFIGARRRNAIAYRSAARWRRFLNS